MFGTLARTPSAAARAADGTDLDGLIAAWTPVLDALGTNIFVASLDLTLKFANRKAHATLALIDQDLRDAFGIRSTDIVGGSIHRFHRDPQRVERVLHRQGFDLPHRADFSFGRVTLQTTIDAVTTLDGTHVGYIVAWQDISDLRRSNEAVADLGEHLEAAAAAIEEMSASIGEISRSATDASEATARGVSDADRTTGAVRELGEASEAVGEVVRTITSIAQQTNLLALNATIEAARAGEAGRGFAVVAGEVKQLARDTADTTDDIEKRITAIRTSVEEVVSSIEGIGTLLREVNDIQQTVTATVEEQRLATDALAESVGDAATSSRAALADGAGA